MRPKAATVEETLALLAARAHGVASRAELLEAGVTPAELKRRLRNGSLIRVHRGVYRVGHAAPSALARYSAAVKACGPGALLARRAAAHLFGILKRAPGRPEVLAAPRHRIPGVVTYRSGNAESDRTVRRGIPVTSPPRTLVDLAAVLPEGDLARAVHEAAVRHRTKPPDVELVLARRHNWPGARKLRRVLYGEIPVTLSRLESLFLERLHGAGLSLPNTNRLAGQRYVDCRWPDRRLTVELDSYTYHHTRHAWEADRAREWEARARGDEFRRYTWRDVSEDPRPMLADLTKLLDRGQ